MKKRSANENDRIAIDSKIFKRLICMFNSILIQFDAEFLRSFAKSSKKVIVKESLVTLFLAIDFRKRTITTHTMRNKIEQSKRNIFKYSPSYKHFVPSVGCPFLAWKEQKKNSKNVFRIKMRFIIALLANLPYLKVHN